MKSDGTIWFTDPTYGIMSDYEGYQRRAGAGDAATSTASIPTAATLTAVVTDFIQPNGLAFSPDETMLYVADSGASHDERPAAPHPRLRCRSTAQRWRAAASSA